MWCYTCIFCAVQLASEAGALVAMTETEKQRLEELLQESEDSFQGQVCNY